MADEKREIKNGTEQVDYITPMLSLLGTAVSTIQTQDLQEITIILQKGKSLFKKKLLPYMELMPLNLETELKSVGIMN
jgi:hypothetical protein